jgi:hypothetical protein
MDKSSHARRLCEIPPRQGPKIEVHRIKGSERLLVCILSPKIWSFLIHWDDLHRRSSPCHEDVTQCEGHKNGLPVKYRGYVWVSSQTRGLCFVELTQEAANTLQEITAGRDSLRGFHCYICRTPAKNGRMRIEESAGYSDPATIPPDKDPLPTLEFLWTWGRR